MVTNSLGCTITVAPTEAYDVKAAGNYDGVSKLTVKITTLPIKVTGGLQCPTTATKASFTATYTFTPVWPRSPNLAALRRSARRV